MAPKSKSWIRENAVGLIVGAVLIPLATYVAVQTRTNEFEIRRLGEKQEEVAASLTAIKQSIVKLSLSKDPKNAEILSSLVFDERTSQGIKLYQSGRVDEAIDTWQRAKLDGSLDARLALKAAGIGPAPDEELRVIGARKVPVPWWKRLSGDEPEE